MKTPAITPSATAPVSDTPQCNRAQWLIHDEGHICPVVHADFARSIERENAQLRAALADAEWLMRSVGINWKEAGSMKDSLLRSASDARTALSTARQLTQGGAK